MVINNEMKRKNMKIIFFIDNASPHAGPELSNVLVKFYPANCTSIIQPLDQGIIKSFKVH